MKKYEVCCSLDLFKPALLTILLTFALFVSGGLSAANAQNCTDNPNNPFANCGFETGDFAGWIVMNQPGGAGDWFVYSGNTSPNLFPILPPPEGIFAAVTDQQGPGSHVLYQDIVVPDRFSVQCSVIVYYESNSEGENSFFSPPTLDYTVSPNQQARIDIMDPLAPVFDVGAGVLLNVFATFPGDPASLNYTVVNFDLTDFAGETVRFRAAEVDNQGNFRFSIDNVDCNGPVSVQQVPTLSEWGLIALAGILGIMGFIAIRRKRLKA